MTLRKQAAGHTGLTLLVIWAVVTAAWWWLALAPVADPPEWLALARSVCFGSTPTGLPDTYGWVVLILAPGSMVVGILGTWSSEIAADIRAAWRVGAGRVALLAAVVLVFAGIGWSALRIAQGLAIANISYEPDVTGTLPSNYPRLDREVPDFTLVDQTGAAFTPENLKGHVTLMTFAFAHCRSVCPVIVNSMRGAASRMGDAAPQLAVLTLDPWRDTPSRLEQMHKDWELPETTRVLSGEVDAVTRTLDGFNVPRQRNEKDGEVVHPALVYVIGVDGRIAYAFNNPSIDWLVEAARRLGESGRS